MDSRVDRINFVKFPDLQYEKSKNNNNAIPVYGSFEKLFIDDWGQSKIHNDIVQAFDKMKISQMKPIQKNSFLYLMNNYNTAMIGFSKGKSISYLASIFSLIKNSCNDEMRKDIGPKAIVLTNSLGSCFKLEELSKKLNLFAKTGKKIEVVVAESSSRAYITEAALCNTNGCNILIVTPNNLINLLKKSKLFSWLNLKHFVFDNLDLLFENNKEQLVYFLQILKKMEENKVKVQCIATSVRWTKEVDEFLNELFIKWQYIFGSHLEAVHYMKIGFNVVHVKDDKLEKILQCLKNNIKCARIVLITSNTDELSIISSYFQQDDFGIEVLLASQLQSSKVFTIQKWNNPLVKNQRLLICSDDMLFDYYIDNADCLIHYDIPEEKQKFSVRFSVLQDSNIIFKKKDRCTYIFLSNSTKDMIQLPKVVEVMQLFGNGELDPILLKHVKIINDGLEQTKLHSVFCYEIQQFGYCPKQLSCQYRHILLKEIDAPLDNIPKSGLAIIKILNVYDASHMSAKLMKLNISNNLNDVQHWMNVEDHSAIIKQELSAFYSNPNSKIIYENPKPGDTVAVLLQVKFREMMNAEYFRATVMDIVDESQMNSEVKVKLVDEGFVKIVSKWKIFELPDKLKNIQTTTVDMFVSSIKPIDFDKVWCAKADISVKKRLKLAENCSDTIIVNVKMALGTTILVNKIYRKYWVTKSNKYDFEAILPDLLLNFGYADLNLEHLGKLTELCTSAGIYLPPPLKKNFESHELNIEEFMSMYRLPQPQWAHLDPSVDDLVQVEYIYGSNRFFYVRNTKFYDQLNDLYTKINHCIEQKQVEELKHIVIGAICLAQYPANNEYNRAQISAILNENLVVIFFVDIGEFHDIASTSLLTILPNLITQLPFQAIECSLKGIKDTLPEGDELEEFVDSMFDLTSNPLYSKVISSNLSAEYTGGNHYEVNLYYQNRDIYGELRTKYPQYFDDNDNVMFEDDVMDSKELIDSKPYFIDDDLFDENTSEYSLPAQDLLNQFGLTLFGQGYENLINGNPEPNIEDIKESPNCAIIKEMIPDITCTTPVTKKDLSEICTNEQSENTVSVDSVMPKLMFARKKKSKLCVERQDVCLTCNINVQSIVPTCIWYQDQNYIFLKFNILEIDNFSISCSAESITFKAQFEDASYAFCARLFAFIIDQNVTHKKSYEGFHIKAEKLYKTKYKWLRLFACNKRHSYTKYDPEKIEVKNRTLWIRELNRIQLKALKNPLNTVEYDSEEDHSDSFTCED